MSPDDIPEDIPEEFRAQIAGEHAKIEAYRKAQIAAQEKHEALLYEVLNALRDAAPSEIAFVSAVAAMKEVSERSNEIMLRLAPGCYILLLRHFAKAWSHLADVNETSVREQEQARCTAIREASR